MPWTKRRWMKTGRTCAYSDGYALKIIIILIRTLFSCLRHETQVKQTAHKGPFVLSETAVKFNLQRVSLATVTKKILNLKILNQHNQRNLLLFYFLLLTDLNCQAIIHIYKLLKAF